MDVKLYGASLSAPTRAVVMAIQTLEIDVGLVPVDMMKGAHLSSHYLKINPQHTVPLLEDDGLYLTESRAILQYLVSAYGKDDSYYPKDLKERAKVDQRLFFDGTCLYPAFSDAYYVIFREKIRPLQAKLDKFDDVLGFLETFLEKSKFSAGDNFTIADFSINATLTTAAALGHDLSKFPKITAYLENSKAIIKDDDFNADGAKDFAGFVNSFLKDIP